ncbi:hypothetical protein KACC15558_22200 [Brevibacterium ammoniilyticum]|uniref:AraC family transcriptional regulator n=1 Tax=Brevibacterium ammoniilyticum TaxID=1046555 RepID=A0ABP9U7A3_9MICO
MPTIDADRTLPRVLFFRVAAIASDSAVWLPGCVSVDMFSCAPLSGETKARAGLLVSDGPTVRLSQEVHM